MNDMMRYKGYFGSVNYSDEDEIFYGKVEYIRSLISYEGDDIKSLKQGFNEAVDDYLQLCQQEKIEPEKPYQGNLYIQLKPDLHKQTEIAAQQKGINLNNLVAEALEKYLK